ncbi:MAG: glycosyltransferase family 2 protein [Nannocystaceae bacterium]|nr:glycosyltransferase family 2 protein [Deltaproteobacteria bacterium]MBP7286559.1 glycosyltransferase family 2 protein [Nannocystaceae bacterium]
MRARASLPASTGACRAGVAVAVVQRCEAPVRLFIQIPCLDEREWLAQTFADLPRSIPGVSAIEVLVVDDGSSDGTSALARELGVHHIVRFPRNRGLAAAHMAGLDACLRLGADIIVNTDADNQYKGSDIARLVEPILAGRADLTIGDRNTDAIAHFSFVKRVLQRWGSRVVRRASGTAVADSTSGFRALSRRAAYGIFVHNRFTYTLETIIQAGHLGLAIENVAIQTNAKARESRLFRSIFEYVRRNGAVILRAYNLYWPVQTFGFLAVVLFLVGGGLGLRFLYYYVQDPDYSGHVQSLLVGVGAVVLSILVALMALLGDLLATNRRLTEEVLLRVRRLEAHGQSPGRAAAATEGIESTAAAPWLPDATALALLPDAAATANAIASSPRREQAT